MATSSINDMSHDVFLNFRGKDTREKFTSHLHFALISNSIRTFIDDDIERGDEISDSILKAIEGSRISITIFSHDYASSTFCLDELLKILECKKDNGQIVLPIFYHVDPEDVEKQKGKYGEAFTEHETQFRGSSQKFKVSKWREALDTVAKLAGYPFPGKGSTEAYFVQLIVKTVLKRLDGQLLHVADHLVGLESHMNWIEDKLDIGSNDVRMVGIWGVSGIGKTTLAKAIFNKLASRFEASIFLLDVKRSTSEQQDGIAKLQEALISEIGINNHKKVLIVIDDVDKDEQLKKLAVECLYLCGMGSRFIITTRDQNLLIGHGVKLIYKMNRLSNKEASELFSWNAFNKSHPNQDFVELSRRIIDNTQGLPLALIVLGSLLFGTGKNKWEDAAKKLQKIPKEEIIEQLKISYDDLGEEEKKTFLDAARLFRGWDKSKIRETLNSKGSGGFSSRYDLLQVLEERCLLQFDVYDKLQMHDLIHKLATQIANSTDTPPLARGVVAPVQPISTSRTIIGPSAVQQLPPFVGNDQINVNNPLKSFGQLDPLTLQSSMNGNSETMVWNLICSLSIPRKVKYFLWSACNDSLPTALNLFRRGEILIEVCPRCGMRRESVRHALLRCPFAASVWFNSPLRIRIYPEQSVSFLNWFMTMRGVLNKQGLQLVATTSWSIWHFRNKLVFQHYLSNPMEVISRAVVVLHEYIQENSNLNPPRITWYPPM